jgi:peptidyl-tRNA hydrolase
MAIKQIIVIRKDLGMRRGKECAQAAHASSMWLINRVKSGVEYHYFTDAEKEWMNERVDERGLRQGYLAGER